jgi:hypothetical protein
VSRILLVTDQWGYGSTTMAMAIASDLVALSDDEGSVDRWLVGDGVGFDLAWRQERDPSRSTFDGFIRVDTLTKEPNADLDEAIRESRVVLSVQNRRVARRAARCGTPCVYVDSLLWMRERPPAPLTVSRYFVEKFPGVEARVQRWRHELPPTHVIGPTIAAWRPAKPDQQASILVNFGGLSAWYVPHRALVAYAATMTECIARAFQTWPGTITVSVGEHVLRDIGDLPQRLARPNVRFRSLDHDDYLAELGRSRLLVSSAGMHAVYEAFASGVPCLLLPSQNLSGARGLQRLARAGVTSRLDWDAIYGLRFRGVAEEPLACAEIARCVDRFQHDAQAMGRLVEHLRAASSKSELDRLATMQTAFFQRMGRRRGSLRVAQYVAELLGASDPGPRR